MKAQIGFRFPAQAGCESPDRIIPPGQPPIAYGAQGSQPNDIA